MRKIFFSIVLLCGFFLGGCCGYSTQSALPPEWRTVFVTPFANKIDYTTEGKRNLYKPLMEVKVRDAIVNRFQFDGHVKVAKEDGADLILKGELVDYTRSPLRYDNNNDVIEYRIQVIVNMVLTEGQNGPEVWVEKGFAGEASYFISGAQVKSEDTALNEAIVDLARRTVERTIENW